MHTHAAVHRQAEREGQTVMTTMARRLAPTMVTGLNIDHALPRHTCVASDSCLSGLADLAYTQACYHTLAT